MSAVPQPFPNARPARRVFYYGWANVAIAAIAMVGTLPGRTQGLGLITEPLIADLRIDRVSYASINLWATLIGSLFCLPCGRLVDSLGSRLVLTRNPLDNIKNTRSIESVWIAGNKVK